MVVPIDSVEGSITKLSYILKKDKFLISSENNENLYEKEPLWLDSRTPLMRLLKHCMVEAM